MNSVELAKLRFLNKLTLPLWHKVDFAIAKALDDSIPYIGAVRVTSTWRPAGSSAASASFHSRGAVSFAIDFEPLGRPMWHVYLIMRSLGQKRIGLNPGANIIHIDSGYWIGKAREYYFLETTAGRDIGPLSIQPESKLRKIPGYGTQPAVGPPGGGPILTTAGAGDSTFMILAGLGILARSFLFG